MVIGAGLAGCEAALQLARRGVPVDLVEMRPGQQTEAHRTGDPAELVCSNSLKSEDEANAHGLLKAELRILGSALLECAERARVPGGRALVVDRGRFAAEVAAALAAAGVSIRRAEANSVPPGPAVVATGPLTSPALAVAVATAVGAERPLAKDADSGDSRHNSRLFFYDAIAPIVAGDTIDRTIAFEASRYGGGPSRTAGQSTPARLRQEAGGDYLNCPLDRDRYLRLRQALVEAELHPVRDFESNYLFEGCLPVEELARRGERTLAFGPLKPVGLSDPRTGAKSFAVVQLRRENAEGTMYNLVGFQTRLRQGEQRRVFRMIPGLERVEFLRYGSMHRNTYLDSPRLLLPTLQTRARADLLVAGQLTGVEGYVESIGAGLAAGINAARICRGDKPVTLPGETMLGALLSYVARGPAVSGARFQPMNANFGLLPKPDGARHKSERRTCQVELALASARRFAAESGVTSAR